MICFKLPAQPTYFGTLWC